jgi:hypothetical protein
MGGSRLAKKKKKKKKKKNQDTDNPEGGEAVPARRMVLSKMPPWSVFVSRTGLRFRPGTPVPGRSDPGTEGDGEPLNGESGARGEDIALPRTLS